jgi:hypothetical protein
VGTHQREEVEWKEAERKAAERKGAGREGRICGRRRWGGRKRKWKASEKF